MHLHEAMLVRMAFRLPPEQPPNRQRRRRDPVGRRGVAAILFMCMFAAQSAQLALTPVLTHVAHEFGISTAGAGQIRTAAAVVAALAALAVGVVATRVHLRALLSAGILLLVVGSLTSVAATSASVLTAGQACTGAASSILVASGVAAAAAWSSEADRGRIVAWTLVGAPSAWVAVMPVIGVLGATSWRLAFAVPVAAAVAAGDRSAPGAGGPLTAVWRRAPRCPGRRHAARLGDQRGARVRSVERSAHLLRRAVRRVLRHIAGRRRPGARARSGRLHPRHVRRAAGLAGAQPPAARGGRRDRSPWACSRSASFGWARSRRRSASAFCASCPARGRIWGAPSASSSQPASMPRPCRSAPLRPRSAGSSAVEPAGPPFPRAATRRWRSRSPRSSPEQRCCTRPGLGWSCDQDVNRPLARYPFDPKRLRLRLAEGEAGAGDEVADGRRHQHLAVLGTLLQAAGH